MKKLEKTLLDIVWNFVSDGGNTSPESNYFELGVSIDNDPKEIDFYVTGWKNHEKWFLNDRAIVSILNGEAILHIGDSPSQSSKSNFIEYFEKEMEKRKIPYKTETHESL